MRARISNCSELNSEIVYDILWYSRNYKGVQDAQIKVFDNGVLKSVKVPFQSIIWLDSEEEKQE